MGIYEALCRRGCSQCWLKLLVLLSLVMEIAMMIHPSEYTGARFDFILDSPIPKPICLERIEPVELRFFAILPSSVTYADEVARRKEVD